MRERLYKENEVLIDDIFYQLKEDKSAKIVGNDIKEIIDLDIPSNITYQDRTYTVDEIDVEAFLDCKYLDWVSIPITVKLVHEKAFKGSSVKQLHFDHRRRDHIVLKDDICFDCIRLEYVRLPGSLVVIPENMFFNNLSLKEVEVFNQVKIISNSSFYMCTKLRHYDFTENIERIGPSAFYGTDLNYIEIGPKVSIVEDMAFAYNENLRTLVIQNNKVKLEEKIITNEKDVIIYIKDHLETSLKNNIDGEQHYIIDPFDFIEQDGIKYILFSKNIGRIVGYNESNIKIQTTVPSIINDVPIIDMQPRALSQSIKLKEVIFPNTIKQIKGKVFENCTNLRKVTFNHEITHEDARWCVYNNGVTIVKPDATLIRFKALIERIHILDDYGVTSQMTFNETFESNSLEEAIIEAKEWCISKTDSHNIYKLVGVRENINI